MAKKILILLSIVLVALFAAIAMLNHTVEHKKVVVNLNNAVLHRIFKNVTLVDSIVLEQEYYDFIAYNDSLFLIPNSKSDEASYFIFDKNKNRINKGTKTPYDISFMQKDESALWIHTTRDSSVYELADETRMEHHQIPERYWRGVITWPLFIYIDSHSDSSNSMHLYNLISHKEISIRQNAKNFPLSGKDNVDVQLSGRFAFCSGKNTAYYVLNKSSHYVRIPIDSFNKTSVHQTIDSLPIPEIVETRISDGVTKATPKTEIFVNTGAVATDKYLIVRSLISKDSGLNYPNMDCYDLTTNTYSFTLDINQSKCQAYRLAFDDKTKLLWILLDDKKTFKSFKITKI